MCGYKKIVSCQGMTNDLHCFSCFHTYFFPQFLAFQRGYAKVELSALDTVGWFRISVSAILGMRFLPIVALSPLMIPNVHYIIFSFSLTIRIFKAFIKNQYNIYYVILTYITDINNMSSCYPFGFEFECNWIWNSNFQKYAKYDPETLGFPGDFVRIKKKKRVRAANANLV